MAPRRRKQTNPMSQGTGKGGGSSVNPMSKGTGTTTAPQSAGSRRRTQAGPPIKRRTTTTTTTTTRKPKPPTPQPQTREQKLLGQYARDAVYARQEQKQKYAIATQKFNVAWGREDRGEDRRLRASDKAAAPRNRATPPPVGDKAPKVPGRRSIMRGPTQPTKSLTRSPRNPSESASSTSTSKRKARPKWTTPGLIDNPEAYKKRFPKAKLRRVKGGAVLVGRGMAGKRPKTKTTSAGPLTKK